MAVSGYSSKQIWLHWIIAALIIVQFVLHEGIDEMADAFEKGLTPEPSLQSQSHVIIGLLIFILALVRIYIHLTRGAPALPAEEPVIQRFLASATHIALYAIILLMPISGAAAWFGGIEQAGDAHELGKVAMIAFVALHVVGAIYQHFVLKTDVVKRMVRAEK